MFESRLPARKTRGAALVAGAAFALLAGCVTTVAVLLAVG